MTDSTADDRDGSDLPTPDEPGDDPTAAERRVAELEAEVESLRRELEQREQERKQLIEAYESRIARLKHGDISDSVGLKLLRLLGLR